MAITGFQNYKRRGEGSPDPQMVGQMLLQQSQQGGMPGGEGAAMGGVPHETPEAEMAESFDTLASEPNPDELARGSEWESSASAALRAAIIRAPSMRRGQQQGPPNALSRAQLIQMGIPEEEVDLLAQSGGANI